jgi:hypothetical protein
VAVEVEFEVWKQEGDDLPFRERRITHSFADVVSDVNPFTPVGHILAHSGCLANSGSFLTDTH